MTALPEVLEETYKDDRGKVHTWSSYWQGVSDHDREDVLQEMRVAAWRGLETHDPAIRDNNPRTRGIATAKTCLRNWLRGRRRREKREGAQETDDALRGHIAPQPDELDRYCTNDMAQLAAGAARHLPAEQSRAIRLRFGLDGDEPHTHSEVADLMDIPQTRAWKLVEDGLKTLRAELRADEILRDTHE